jgi:hypothetical protein
MIACNMQNQDRPHQRKGAASNAHVGRDFETVAQIHLARHGINTQTRFKLSIGVGGRCKQHGFDLGSSEPSVVVECKSHCWTEGDKVPSAKMAVWNEAMYCFSLVPKDVRRILFVLRHCRASSGESLVDYYLRTHGHLAQPGVEIWEYDEVTSSHKIHVII